MSGPKDRTPGTESLHFFPCSAGLTVLGKSPLCQPTKAGHFKSDNPFAARQMKFSTIPLVKEEDAAYAQFPFQRLDSSVGRAED